MKKLYFLFLFFFFSLSTLFSQNNKKNSWWKENTTTAGYVKYMNSTSFKNLNNLLTDNLIHNRINFRMYVNPDITFDLQLRNRVFWGQSLQSAFFKDFIDSDDEINLSTFLIDKPGLLFHSKIDRLSLSYVLDEWEIKIGRQRVNWGKTWAWNSNDLFNAYNFLEFDYEERPGSDAISILRNYGESSIIQAVYSYGKDLDHSIIALRNQFSIKTYDIQLIAASYYTDYAFGIGWEGYIKDAGFKGETTVFIPKESDLESETAVLTSLSADYFFKNGLMLIGSVLYNSNGVTDAESFDIQSFLGESSSARNLMPNKFSYLLQSSYQINPPSSVSLGVMYMQGFGAVALLPSYAYSIKNNWDADVFGQLFFGKSENKFQNIQNGIYFRMRYSY